MSEGKVAGCRRLAKENDRDRARSEPMTDAQGKQLTYRQIAERMTLKAWTEREQSTPALSVVEPPAEQVQPLLPE